MFVIVILCFISVNLLFISGVNYKKPPDVMKLLVRIISLWIIYKVVKEKAKT